MELPALFSELESMSTPQKSADGNEYFIREVIAVYDGGSIEGAAALRDVALQSELVRVVWLSRNFGQHPATLAGMSASASEWIVTLDEDGQFPPSAIPELLDHAMKEQCPVVYGQPTTLTPHPLWRRATSWLARSLFKLASDNKDWSRFSSFRLILGELGRAVGAYCTNETYLDVALTWVSPRSSSIRIPYRDSHTSSAYSLGKLSAHFMRMFLTMGTRPMRIFAAAGAFAALVGFGLSGALLYRRVVFGFPTGFASTLALLLVMTGLLLLGLAVLAEYIGLIVRNAIGRPLYVSVSDPTQSALTRDRNTENP
jgi:glycosyltransferase involved in cell wall biosynthesis